MVTKIKDKRKWQHKQRTLPFGKLKAGMFFMDNNNLCVKLNYKKLHDNYYDYSRQMMRRWWVDDPATVVDVRIIVNNISQIADAILLDYRDPAEHNEQ